MQWYYQYEYNYRHLQEYEPLSHFLIILEKEGIVKEYNSVSAKGYYTLVNKKENES